MKAKLIREYIELDNGANIESKDDDGSTPLIAASGEQNKNLVEYLCNNGANVNATDNKGWTAFNDFMFIRK